MILEDRNKSLFLGSDPLTSLQNLLDTKGPNQALLETLFFISCLEKKWIIDLKNTEKCFLSDIRESKQYREKGSLTP